MLDSVFQNADGLLSSQSIQDIIGKSYAPYTQRVAQSDIDVRFMGGLPDHCAAALLHDGVTGDVGGIVIQKNIQQSYSGKLALEHESVHYDQVIHAPDYKMNLLFDPRDAHIMERIKELEAHFRHHYKFAMDFKNNLVTEKDLNIYQNLPMLPSFLTAYLKKNVDPSNIAGDLQALKKSEAVEPARVMPAFFYYASFSNGYLNQISDDALAQRMDHMDELQMSGRAGIERTKTVMGLSPDVKLFQKNFSIDDADLFLNRDGNEYMERLRPELRDEFWKNVSSLDPQREACVQRMRAQASVCS